LWNVLHMKTCIQILCLIESGAECLSDAALVQVVFSHLLVEFIGRKSSSQKNIPEKLSLSVARKNHSVKNSPKHWSYTLGRHIQELYFLLCRLSGHYVLFSCQTWEFSWSSQKHVLVSQMKPSMYKYIRLEQWGCEWLIKCGNVGNCAGIWLERGHSAHF